MKPSAFDVLNRVWELPSLEQDQRRWCVNSKYVLKPLGRIMMEAAQDDVKVKIGKMIFYITLAVGLWFFYWFGGIQCPC